MHARVFLCFPQARTHVMAGSGEPLCPGLEGVYEESRAAQLIRTSPLWTVKLDTSLSCLKHCISGSLHYSSLEPTLMNTPPAPVGQTKRQEMTQNWPQWLLGPGQPQGSFLAPSQHQEGTRVTPPETMEGWG